jgi:3-oxoacyl-[acyl-carrier-protein] synthase-3
MTKEGQTKFVKIAGVGSYVPEKILTNADLSAMVDTSDEWIVTRTGIRERRIAGEGEATSDLCVAAARRALQAANMDVGDIDLLMVGTMTADFPLPAAATVVQSKLAIGNIPCFDFFTACSGLQYGLAIAQSMILGPGNYDNVLLICGDKLSVVTDWQDRSTCVLFGDGAGAVVLSATDRQEENSIVDILLGAKGECAELVYIPGGGSKEPASEETVRDRKHFMKMVGRELFREAVAAMGNCVQEILRRNGMTMDDIDFVVPHQSNLRIMEAVGERFQIPLEKICVTIDRYGNTSASSCIIALNSLIEAGKILRGTKILSVAFGGGLTWGASILKF